MGDLIPHEKFLEYRAAFIAKHDKSVVDYVCYVCGHKWEGPKPQGMEKVRCPECNDTLIRYKPRS